MTPPNTPSEELEEHSVSEHDDAPDSTPAGEVVIFDVEALEDEDLHDDDLHDANVHEHSGHDGAPADEAPSADAVTEVLPAVETTRLDTIGHGVEVVVECPQCGLVCEGVDPRPTAAWFCPRCDYPLFLAAPVPPAAISSDAARRRLPGTDGREVLAAEPCWACGEKNPAGLTHCTRCSSELVRPQLPPLEEPEPIIIEQPPLIYVARRWPLILTGAAAGTIATFVAVLLAIGLR